MRDLFREYYRPSDEEFSRLWQKATFVFDTNVLLHLYRYTPSTRNDLLKVIEALQQRIWIPHQVGLEFSRDRVTVITEQNSIFSLIKAFDTFVEEKFKKEIVQRYGKRGHFFADLEKIQAIFQQTKQDLEEELQQTRAKYPDPMEHDDVMLEQLDKLLQGRIGSPYSEEKLAQLSAEFEKRYKQGKPPGFKDAKKNPSQQKNDQASKVPSQQEDDSSNPANKYGDVILWYQLIDYAKQEKHPIILVGDDGKEDWWQRIHGKTLGPRAELRREMLEEANVLFYMYNFDNFLKKAQEFLEVQVQRGTIEEVREKRLQEAKLRENRILSNLYPSPLLYPNNNLFPSSVIIQEMMQRAKTIQQIVDAFGGFAELSRQLHQQQQFLKQVQPFLPPSVAPGEDREDLEDFQTSEDDELDQNQQDNSSDDTDSLSNE